MNLLFFVVEAQITFCGAVTAGTFALLLLVPVSTKVFRLQTTTSIMIWIRVVYQHQKFYERGIICRKIIQSQTLYTIYFLYINNTKHNNLSHINNITTNGCFIIIIFFFLIIFYPHFSLKTTIFMSLKNNKQPNAIQDTAFFFYLLRYNDC